MGELWINTYRPKTIKAVPQDAALKLEKFVKEFSKQKKKAMFLFGPSGTCKSCAVHALANDLNWEVIEVNASDVRNEAQIEERLGNALKQRSLLYSGKIVLMDEVDGVSGTNDRGGIPAVVRLIADTKFPIILTAQDPFDKKFSALRSKSTMVEFPALSPDAVTNILQEICTKEKITADTAVLKALARKSGGDLRSSINDLQLLSQGNKNISQDSLSLLDDRNRVENIENALIKVFKNTDPKLAMGAFDQTGKSYDEIFLWLDHNIAKEYTNPADRARAYDILSKADVFRGRIRRWQHWRFLSHIFELLTAGIAVAKDERYKTPPNYERNTRLLKIWQANMKYAKRKAIAQKVAAVTHSSAKTVIQNTLPWLQVILKNKPDQAQAIADEFDLDEEELMWLVR